MTFGQNFIEIDDKILKRAAAQYKSMKASNCNIDAFHQDIELLGIVRPDCMPRTTRWLDKIREFIGELDNKGAASSGVRAGVSMNWMEAVKLQPNRP